MKWSILYHWVRDEDATTAAEYAVMLVLIIVAVIGAVTAVGNSTAQGWNNNVNVISGALNHTSGS